MDPTLIPPLQSISTGDEARFESLFEAALEPHVRADQHIAAAVKAGGTVMADALRRFVAMNANKAEVRGETEHAWR